MVANVVKKPLLAGVVLLLALLMISIFAPTVADKSGEHSAAIILKSAFSSYRNKHGRSPQTIVELEPFLEESTRRDCTITEPEAGHYHVEMCAEHRVFHVDVEYRLNRKGQVERYHVGNIRTERNGDCASGTRRQSGSP